MIIFYHTSLIYPHLPFIYWEDLGIHMMLLLIASIRHRGNDTVMVILTQLEIYFS